MSRRKGKRFERECAKRFTQYTGHKWETTRNSGRTDLKGDIYCLSYPNLPVVVECKSDKRYTVHAMLRPTREFWNMVHRARDKARDCQLIIILKNETGIWMMSEPNTFGAIKHCDRIVTAFCGVWTQLRDIAFSRIYDRKGFDGTERELMVFDVQRLGKTSKKRKE